MNRWCWYCGAELDDGVDMSGECPVPTCRAPLKAYCPGTNPETRKPCRQMGRLQERKCPWCRVERSRGEVITMGDPRIGKPVF